MTVSFGPTTLMAPPTAPGELPKGWNIIVGSGPGGLTAAIYLVRYGLRVLVVEKDALDGRVTFTPLVENYPPFVEISGEDLARRFAKHAESAGVQFLYPSIPCVYAVGDVAGYLMQISKAVGDGTRAAVDAFEEVFGGPYGSGELRRRWEEEWRGRSRPL